MLKLRLTTSSSFSTTDSANTNKMTFGQLDNSVNLTIREILHKAFASTFARTFLCCLLRQASRAWNVASSEIKTDTWMQHKISVH